MSPTPVGYQKFPVVATRMVLTWKTLELVEAEAGGWCKSRVLYPLHSRVPKGAECRSEIRVQHSLPPNLKRARRYQETRLQSPQPGHRLLGELVNSLRVEGSAGKACAKMMAMTTIGRPPSQGCDRSFEFQAQLAQDDGQRSRRDAVSRMRDSTGLESVLIPAT